jgi:WD40 repeat protein
MTIQRVCGYSGLFALLVFGGCEQRVLIGTMNGTGGVTGGAGNGGPFPVTGTGGGYGGVAGYAGSGGAIVFGGGGNGGGGPPRNSSCSSISTTPGEVNLCGRTSGVAISLDGKVLAIGSDGAPPNVHLFSLPGGAHLRDLDGGPLGTYAVAFSRDSRTLAIGGQAQDNGGTTPTAPVAKLYDVASGALLHPLATTSGFYVDSVAFSDDGTLVATGGYKGAIEVWNVSDGTIATRIPYGTSVHNVHFGFGGTQLIAGGVDERATIWNIPAGTLAMTLDGIANEMADADFSPDFQLIASTSNTNNNIKVWDAFGGLLLQTLPGHTTYVSHVVWVNTDRFLTDDWSGVVNSWTRGSFGLFAPSGTWNIGSQALGMAVLGNQVAVAGNDGLVFLAL